MAGAARWRQYVTANPEHIAEDFSCVNIALDTTSRGGVDGGNKDHARRQLAARFA